MTAAACRGARTSLPACRLQFSIPHGSSMNRQDDIEACVEGALQARRFAVLATERDGQPHSSLVAITPMGGSRELLFATYRDTRKYRNLVSNSKVSVFVDGRWTERAGSGAQDGFVLTALGHAHEVASVDRKAACVAHLQRHPDLDAFLGSPNCAMVRVTVQAYQVVGAIDDVKWWRLASS
jgi:nitroimidazol reductase NimA-like FMN-containing flavoprotein (pyridoxamine 5'-phosphate oxidase superfamily)